MDWPGGYSSNTLGSPLSGRSGRKASGCLTTAHPHTTTEYSNRLFVVRLVLPVLNAAPVQRNIQGKRALPGPPSEPATAAGRTSSRGAHPSVMMRRPPPPPLPTTLAGAPPPPQSSARHHPPTDHRTALLQRAAPGIRFVMVRVHAPPRRGHWRGQAQPFGRGCARGQKGGGLRLKDH